LGLQKKDLEQQINALKLEYDKNFDRIFFLEKRLTRICDQELKNSLLDLKLFDHLNNEKPSPNFLSLAKKK
jgi:hypothetical protein